MVSPDCSSASAALTRRVLSDMGVAVPDIPAEEPPSVVPLPSRLDTGGLARGSIDALRVLAGIDAQSDSDRIALAYRSDRVLRLDGIRPSVWDPSSGFWETTDGWIRTHGNYPHHASRLLDALALPQHSDADDLRRALSRLPREEALDRICSHRGLAVPVLTEDPRIDEALRRTPLIDVQKIDVEKTDVRQTDAGHIDVHHADSDMGSTLSGSDTLLDGIRVLDLTRVIAGPVCTRTLALLGADVLRLDPPHLPEPEWQHLDTGHGKRSAILDASASAEPLDDLVRQAHVVVLGYRPASLDRLGLSPEQLAARHPDLVIAQLSAWGTGAPDRAGFDSLVQAESGIAMIESPDGATPGVLPAQALDHSAGYLLAAGVLAALERRRREGGTWIVRTSLRRVAAELLGMPRQSAAESGREIDERSHLTTFDIDGRALTTVRPVLPGLEFRSPRRFGGDQPRW